MNPSFRRNAYLSINDKLRVLEVVDHIDRISDTKYSMRQILPIVKRTIGFEISRCTLQRIVSQRKRMESIPSNYGEMKRMKLSDPLRLEFDKQEK